MQCHAGFHANAVADPSSADEDTIVCVNAFDYAAKLNDELVVQILHLIPIEPAKKRPDSLA